MNILFVGLPGSGKSTIARIVAKELGKPFIDIDEKIEENICMNLQTYIDTYGNESFKQKERQIIMDIIQSCDNSVISPPGSLIYYPELLNYICESKSKFMILYLKCSLDTVLKRTNYFENRGVILDKTSKTPYQDLYDERISLYEKMTHREINAENDIPINVEIIKKQIFVKPMNLIKKIVPSLIEEIQAFYTVIHPGMPITGEIFECLLHQAFSKNNIHTTWKPNRSHKVGEDMRLIGILNSRISCKSGIIEIPKKTTHTLNELKELCVKNCIHKNNVKKEDYINCLKENNIDIPAKSTKPITVKISGSRTSSIKGMEEKVEYLSQDSDDIYCCLAKKEQFDGTYTLCVFPSYMIKPNKLKWSKSNSGKQFIGSGQFSAIIQGESTSGQLWTTIPLDYIPYTFNITSCGKN